jgi:hypothetical protein
MGKRGRTYHRDTLLNDKVIVHVETEEGKIVKMLCDPEKIKIIGYVD